MTAGWMPGAERIHGIYRYTPGGEAKIGFCDHTAGGFLNTMRRPDFWNESVKCSVHFAVGRDGRKVQLVNIFDRAWAQGILYNVTWPGYAAMGYRNPNEYFISTEHEDWIIVNGVARAVPNSEWTQAEYQADIEIKEWCIEEFKRVKGIDLMPFKKDSLASHHMFNSRDRANCAGKFWRDVYQDSIWQDLSGNSEDEMFVRHLGLANEGFFKDLNLNGEIDVWTKSPVPNDWNLPDEANDMEVCVYLRSGELDLLDGDGFKAGFCSGRHTTYRVRRGSGERRSIKLAGQAVIDKLEVLGYYA